MFVGLESRQRLEGFTYGTMAVRYRYNSTKPAATYMQWSKRATLFERIDHFQVLSVDPMYVSITFQEYVARYVSGIRENIGPLVKKI